MQIDVIVAGGGASGLVAAITCARRGRKVLLIEKNLRPGRKLSVTGNGKCNLTNKSIQVTDYHTSCQRELQEILNLYNTRQILTFFREIGLPCKERNGYYYPLSEQAAAVVQFLIEECKRLGVVIHVEETIISLKKENSSFFIQTDKNTYTSNKIVLSLGGAAAPVYGSDDCGYRILSALGHQVVPIQPALTGLIVKEKYIKKLSGVRLEAAISLQCGNLKYKEHGEIIFTENGVSGIPVFQFSRFAAEYLSKGQEPLIHIDILPNQSMKDMITYCQDLIHHNPKLPIEYLFRGSCNNKLVYALLSENNISAEQDCDRFDSVRLSKIIQFMKNIELIVIGTKGFEHAQVTAGGVPLNEVNHKTMESTKVPGLYITGELLDVDGICGGYNLHFAWASGMIAGEHL